MLKKIIFPVLLIGLILATTTQVDAQHKSFERKINNKIEKTENISMDNCTQMSKCIEKIAENTEMRNQMLQKLNDNFEKADPVPIGLENIQERPVQINKTKIDNANSEKHNSNLLKKLPYKRK